MLCWMPWWSKVHTAAACKLLLPRMERNSSKKAVRWKLPISEEFHCVGSSVHCWTHFLSPPFSGALFLPPVAVICTFIVFNLPANSLSFSVMAQPLTCVWVCALVCASAATDRHFVITTTTITITLWSCVLCMSSQTCRFSCSFSGTTFPHWECRKMGRWSHKLVRSGPQHSRTVFLLLWLTWSCSPILLPPPFRVAHLSVC